MKTVKTILIAISAFAFVYLSLAFIQWDLNAGNWEDGVRFLVVFLGGVFGILLSIFYYSDLHK